MISTAKLQHTHPVLKSLRYMQWLIRPTPAFSGGMRPIFGLLGWQMERQQHMK